MNGRFRFRAGANTLIGENGSGKTNAFHALRLLLDESLERNAIYLRETDFCRELKKWQGHWIIIAIDFDKLDPSEGCQLLRHKAAHVNGSETGTCTFYYRPKADIRRKLYTLSQSEGDITEFLSTITVDNYEPVLTGRANGDFLDDETYRVCVGDFEDGAFPNPDNDDQDVLGVPIDRIYQEVACTFVKALRDAVSELRGYRGNPLLALLRGMESCIEIADSERISNRVKDLNSDISTLAEITSLASRIETSLKKTVGHTYGPSITIESALPNSMEKLLQRLCLLIGDSGSSDYRAELSEQSLGDANLIYLALKLLEYELKLSTDRVAHFFLIEEPEAHIHTHIQKTIFARLPSRNTQVIVSTHSTHISSAAKIATVNVLAKVGNHCEVYQPGTGLKPITMKCLERYLDAVRSTLLFAKGVLLVEGETEQIMIPAMLRAAFGISPDEMGFSVISMDCAFFENVAIIFSEERLRRPCAILTDLDKALIKLPDNPEDDNADERHARAAAESGKLRCKRLSDLANGNPWVKPFFVRYTFEVDFIHAANQREVVQTLDHIYEQAESKARSKERLESDDKRASGTEVLRLAQKVGKGWFALLLADNLCPRTYFPQQILRAIAFACSRSITDATLKQIAQFRINKEGIADEGAKALPDEAELEALDSSKFLAAFRKAAPEDELSLFLKHVEEFRER